jgi:hypothetical protein
LCVRSNGRDLGNEILHLRRGEDERSRVRRGRVPERECPAGEFGDRAADRLDWSKAVIDSSHVRALKGGPKPARARSTEARPAPSTTLITDGNGIPLAVSLTSGNRNDILSSLH